MLVIKTLHSRIKLTTSGNATTDPSQVPLLTSRVIWT